jgi:hypothetical protein
MASKSTTSGHCKKYACLFCNYYGRKDNVIVHCKTKHTLETTCGGEIIGKIRIIQDNSGCWSGFCFGCYNFIPCKYSVLSSIRCASQQHRCKNSIEPHLQQTQTEHTDQSSNVEKVLEELLRKKCPDLFEFEEEGDTFSVIDIVQQLIWSKNMSHKKFIENQDKFEKQIQELKREKMEIRTEKAHLENMLVAKTERITYLDDRIRTFQHQHENCSLAIKY